MVDSGIRTRQLLRPNRSDSRHTCYTRQQLSRLELCAPWAISGNGKKLLNWIFSFRKKFFDRKKNNVALEKICKSFRFIRFCKKHYVHLYCTFKRMLTLTVASSQWYLLMNSTEASTFAVCQKWSGLYFPKKSFGHVLIFADAQEQPKIKNHSQSSEQKFLRTSYIFDD